MIRVLAVNPTVNAGLAKIIISLVTGSTVIVHIIDVTFTAIAENGIGKSGWCLRLCECSKGAREFDWHGLGCSKRSRDWCLFLVLLNLFTDSLTKLVKIFLTVQEIRYSIGNNFTKLGRGNVLSDGSRRLWGGSSRNGE